MPQPIDHSQPTGIWLTSTSARLNNNLKKHNINVLSEGQISGMNGLFLGLAKREGLEGFCLLGEIPLYAIQIENPKASCAVLEALARIMELELDSHPGPIDQDDIEKIKKSLSQLTKLPFSAKERIERLFKEAQVDISRAAELKIELDNWNAYKEYEDRFLDLFRSGRDKGN